MVRQIETGRFAASAAAKAATDNDSEALAVQWQL